MRWKAGPLARHRVSGRLRQSWPCYGSAALNERANTDGGKAVVKTAVEPLGK